MQAEAPSISLNATLLRQQRLDISHGRFRSNSDPCISRDGMLGRIKRLLRKLRELDSQALVLPELAGWLASGEIPEDITGLPEVQSGAVGSGEAAVAGGSGQAGAIAMGLDDDGSGRKRRKRSHSWSGADHHHISLSREFADDSFEETARIVWKLLDASRGSEEAFLNVALGSTPQSPLQAAKLPRHRKRYLRSHAEDFESAESARGSGLPSTKSARSQASPPRAASLVPIRGMHGNKWRSQARYQAPARRSPSAVHPPPPRGQGQFRGSAARRILLLAGLSRARRLDRRVPGVNLRGSHAGTGAGRGGKPSGGGMPARTMSRLSHKPSGGGMPARTSSRLSHDLPAEGNVSSVGIAGIASAQPPAVLVQKDLRWKRTTRGSIQPARVGGLDQEIAPNTRPDAAVEATTGTASGSKRLAAESVEPLSRHRLELSSGEMWTSSRGSPVAGGLPVLGATGGLLASGNSRGRGLLPASHRDAVDRSLQTSGSARAKQSNTQGVRRKRVRSAEGISTPRLWKSRVVHLPDDHEAQGPRDRAPAQGATTVTFLQASRAAVGVGGPGASAGQEGPGSGSEPARDDTVPATGTRGRARAASSPRLVDGRVSDAHARGETDVPRSAWAEQAGALSRTQSIAAMQNIVRTSAGADAGNGAGVDVGVGVGVGLGTDAEALHPRSGREASTGVDASGGRSSTRSSSRLDDEDETVARALGGALGAAIRRRAAVQQATSQSSQNHGLLFAADGAGGSFSGLGAGMGPECSRQEISQEARDVSTGRLLSLERIVGDLQHFKAMKNSGRNGGTGAGWDKSP